MLTRLALVGALFSFGFMQAAQARECWEITNLRGFSALEGEEYKFVRDQNTDPMRLCFDRDTGTVTGDETKLVKSGQSTLIGNAEANGIYLYEVYTLDRENLKLLFTKNRLASKGGSLSFIGGMIAAFVGDAKLFSKD